MQSKFTLESFKEPFKVNDSETRQIKEPVLSGPTPNDKMETHIRTLSPSVSITTSLAAY